MILANFLKTVTPIVTIFSKNFKNHIKGEFFEIWEFALVMIYVISHKIDNLGSKMKFLKFLEIQYLAQQIFQAILFKWVVQYVLRSIEFI